MMDGKKGVLSKLNRWESGFLSRLAEIKLKVAGGLCSRRPPNHADEAGTERVLLDSCVPDLSEGLRTEPLVTDDLVFGSAWE